MILAQILKRKDAASVVIAVALGLFVAQFTSVFASGLTGYIADLINQAESAPAPIFDWRVSVFEPAMLLIVQTVLLEGLMWVVIGVRGLLRHAKTE